MKHSDLPLTSTHWGAYRVETQDGRVKALHGFEEDTDSSEIGNGIIDVLDGPSRIQTPMVRESWLKSGPGSNNQQRGADPFISVSWETAERLVADELNRVRNEFGNSAIYAGSYGWASAGRFHHAQSQVHRFLNCIGGYTRSVNTYSLASAEVILPHILAPLFPLLAESTSWPSVIENTDLLVAFGGIPLKNGQINSGGVGRHVQKEHLQEAAEAGVELINISPVRSDIDDFARTEWLAPRPSTDAALLIAIAQILHTEGLVDKDFVTRYTHGYEEFIPYLTGEKDGIVKDAAWAAEITGLSADAIQSLALRMAKGRTMLSLSWSLTRQHHGEQAYWAGVTVAAMLGQVGLPGGGITFGYSATNSIGDNNVKIPGASLPQGKNQVADFIPVARISDLLLNPGGDFEFNGKCYQYPDTHLVYWAGGNPFHHHQDINRMLEAWQKPDTIIVNEWCWNSIAKHADIVLPCTTNFERNDIAISPRDSYMVNMQQIIEPVGESRNDYDIFAGIAEKMGLEVEFTEGRDEAQWLDWIYNTTRENALKRSIDIPDYQTFKSCGWFKPTDPTTPVVMLKAFRDDPEANALPTVTGKIEIYSPTVASFGYDDCPGHATWIEPLEWLGGDISEYPLHLISNQPAKKLHSQLDHGSYSRSGKIKGREPITLNPTDAASRELEAGQIVRVFNSRGACLAAVVISDEVMQGAVQMSTGAWYDPVEPGKIGSLCKHGSVNVLTPDVPTSKLGQGPIAHTCMVEIERFEGELPLITAFDPPVIYQS
jgi:biotin/methionine sulfoxide reductase